MDTVERKQGCKIEKQNSTNKSQQRTRSITVNLVVLCGKQTILKIRTVLKNSRGIHAGGLNIRKTKRIHRPCNAELRGS